MNWKVPFFDLRFGHEEKEAAISVIKSNWLTSGPKISEFEEAFSSSLEDEVFAVAVSSATAALHLSMIALDIGPGDEVILPSLTFVACANAVKYVGATPIFADIKSEDDWNISVNDVISKINSRTRAIMVVHYAGYSCDMDSFKEVCQKYGLFLIEDCSHAPLSKWKHKNVGTFGDFGCYSFYSNKNMTTGEGGMIVSRNKKLIERLKILRSHGITSSTYQRFKGHVYGYDVAEIGYNYRMDEIRAAIGLCQLSKLPLLNSKRKERVERYRYLIKEKLPQVKVPFLNNRMHSSYHIFPILITGREGIRDKILQDLSKKSIQCSIHYRPIHTFTAYQSSLADVPITNLIASSILTLPLFPELTNEQMDAVIDALGDSL